MIEKPYFILNLITEDNYDSFINIIYKNKYWTDARSSSIIDKTLQVFSIFKMLKKCMIEL